MHSLAVSVFLILATGYSTATSLQETLSLVGGKFEHGLNYDGAQDSEGIKRQLDLAKDNTWQFFYFCENGKNKKICGSWVDAVSFHELYLISEWLAEWKQDKGS